MTEAYMRAQQEYYDWFEARGRRTSIDGTGPENPFLEGTPEHEDYDRGYWDEYNCCVLIEMGR